MDWRTRILIERLVGEGIDVTAIPAFVRSVAYMVLASPHLSLRELNSRLYLLGWKDIELDVDTLQIVLAIFEPDFQPSSHS
jgi:hypothetical protein